MSVPLSIDHLAVPCLGSPPEGADRDIARSATRGILCRVATILSLLSILPQTHGEIPWPEVVQRVAEENEKLARRPQGHDGEYFVVCTIYYTPVESGFTAERGFDSTPETRPGLRGHKYPREFFDAVKKEGFGRIVTPVNDQRYIRYEGGNSFAFATHPAGRGGELVPHLSAAAHRTLRAFSLNNQIATRNDTVRQVFGTTIWRIADTGGRLHHWQLDLYWGEDEPLGPGKLLARPRGTDFEYTYSEAKVRKEETTN